MGILLTEDELKSYCTYLQEEEKSQATIEKYKRDIRKLYCFLEDKEQLDKQMMIRYKNHLVNRYTGVSVNSMLAAVNSFFTYLGRDDLRVRPLKIQRQLIGREERELTKGEYTCLLSAARKKKDKRLFYIMQTLCTTGIRISELAFITVSAVKQGRAEIHCKSKSRIVFIPAGLRRMLLDYCKRRGIYAGTVFVTRSGCPVHRSNIWAEMKKIGAKTDVLLEKVFPHNLRHLFAVTYYSANKDMAALADILGHSSVETTRIYTMTSGKMYRKRIEELNLLII